MAPRKVHLRRWLIGAMFVLIVFGLLSRAALRSGGGFIVAVVVLCGLVGVDRYLSRR